MRRMPHAYTIGEVTCMEKQFSDMQALLKGDARAWKYYNMLPDQIRVDISVDPAGIRSFDGLQAHAQRLMGGRA